MAPAELDIRKSFTKERVEKIWADFLESHQKKIV